MVFVGIYRAVYDYAPQSENELELTEGDLLFVLEKSTDDDWWKAKKKAQNDEEDEPEGLIPNNYVEEAEPLSKAKAIYDYSRQTDEELSFAEDDVLEVYDTSDPDWTLVGAKGEFGFAPANYIDLTDDASASAAPAAPPMPARPTISDPEHEDEPQQSPSYATSSISGPAADLASILAQRTGQSHEPTRSAVSPPPAIPAQSKPVRRVQFTPEESDDEGPPPPTPARPQSQTLSPPPTNYGSPRTPSSPAFTLPSPPHRAAVGYDDDDEDASSFRPPASPSGYHLYNIHEMVEHMGKKKKMPMTLGINIPKGLIMIAPEKSRDGPQKEWTADKLRYHSQEGKHVFMELVQPSKSVDFHAGAKDTATEIVAYLGELSGGARAGGLREVLAAGSGSSNVQRKGKILYDFMAQGDDEVSVAIDDEVIVIDDSKSEEWWQVRRLKNGKEGVVPSSYVEITETVSIAPSSQTGINAGRSTVEQNRLEEERLAKEAARSNRRSTSDGAEVGPGVPLPKRYSSLHHSKSEAERQQSQRNRESTSSKSAPKSKPNTKRVRQWTDRSGSFKVDAEFIGLKDGKIHLHKTNGVKIAVPTGKMSTADLEYVENMTGVSLDEDKPLSDIKRRSTLKAQQDRDRGSRTGISVEQKKPDYDWFDFFLQCGVNPQICQTYTSAFERDQMGKENIPDLNERLLRTLGLKEGDILRVMKHVETMYGKKGVGFAEGDEGANGGLFSGPGGALRNNTRKGRPAPPVSTNDTVDAKAFEQKSDDTVKKPLADATPTPLATAPERKPAEGFDDNAWEVKPAKTPASPPPAAQAAAPAPVPKPTVNTPAPAPPSGAMDDLSLLALPLQPEIAAPKPAPAAAPVSQPDVQPLQQPTAPAQAPQQTGATPSLFDQLAKAQPPLPQGTMAPPRQRPLAPQQTQGLGGIAPPPARAASAPQNFQQQSAFGPPPPLQPQMTGYQAPQMYTQVAPPGQSLQELQQQRLQQQQFLQMQPTGFQQQPQFNQFQQNGQFQGGIMQQPTGFNPQQQQPGFMQTQPTGFGQQFGGGPQNGSPFADPPRQPFLPQPTGFQQSTYQPQPLNPQATGINAFLPPALTPQRTGAFGSPAQQNSFTPPPVPPMPTGLQAPQPLVPQKTGPAPAVKFGVQPGAKKLAPQPTGRRANLSQATPQNPFGF